MSDRLLPGQPNTLALCFDRPLDHIEGYEDFKENWGPYQPRVFMRKAQFSYGWDWGPRLPNIGIWRPVELRREQRAMITGTHFYTLEIDRAEARAGGGQGRGRTVREPGRAGGERPADVAGSVTRSRARP